MNSCKTCEYWDSLEKKEYEGFGYCFCEEFSKEGYNKNKSVCFIDSVGVCMVTTEKFGCEFWKEEK